MKTFWLSLAACITAWGAMLRFLKLVLDQQADMTEGFVGAGIGLLCGITGLVLAIFSVRKHPPRSVRRTWAVCLVVLNSIATELAVLLAAAMAFFAMAVSEMMEYM